MRPTKILLLLVMAALAGIAIADTATAQWNPYGGPYGNPGNYYQYNYGPFYQGTYWNWYGAWWQGPWFNYQQVTVDPRGGFESRTRIGPL